MGGCAGKEEGTGDKTCQGVHPEVWARAASQHSKDAGSVRYDPVAVSFELPVSDPKQKSPSILPVYTGDNLYPSFIVVLRRSSRDASALRHCPTR